MKTDARVRYTKMILRETLLKCMNRKQLKDITVTEVCRLADINRATFYNHYKDCYAIVNEVEQEQLEVFRTLLIEKKKTGAELLRYILNSIDKAIDLTGGEGGKMLPESFRDGLIETAMKYGVRGWKDRLPGVDGREAELAYEGLLAAAFRIAMTSYDRYDREPVVKTIMGMFSAYIEAHTENEDNDSISDNKQEVQK